VGNTGPEVGVTVTAPEPAEPAPVVTIKCELLAKEMEAVTPFSDTEVMEGNRPVKVTVVPPVVTPETGEIEATPNSNTVTDPPLTC